MSTHSWDTRADRAERLREAVRALRERSSWRQAARATGVSTGALRGFLDGGTPHENTMRILEEWAAATGVLGTRAPAPEAVRPVWLPLDQIAAIVREIRQRCGMTQQRLAEELGVAQPQVSQWEAGQARPDFTLLDAIAQLDGRDGRIFFAPEEGRPAARSIAPMDSDTEFWTQYRAIEAADMPEHWKVWRTDALAAALRVLTQARDADAARERARNMGADATRPLDEIEPGGRIAKELPIFDRRKRDKDKGNGTR